MIEKIDLSSLFPLQKELDEEIASLHGVSYEATFDRRLLALLVELGEFANETRCFKYWSLKGPSEKSIILDEYADGMHFIISLGIPLGEKGFAYTPIENELTLSQAIVKVYGLVSALYEHYDLAHYEEAFAAFLDILPKLGYNGDDAIAAYKSKMAVNHKRQETKY